MALRRSSFSELGGFNERFRGNAWGFEADLGLRFSKKGKFGRYIGDAIVIHKEIKTGGSRHASKRQWFSDYLHNHRLLIANLGMQAWVGALPRLAKRAVWLIAGK
jgi:GT2 family glycosyltransferase